MGILGRYDENTNALQPTGLGRYDETSSEASQSDDEMNPVCKKDKATPSRVLSSTKTLNPP